MPYPSEHACRLKEPGLYQEESFRRIARGNLVLVIARRKGKTTTEAQAYRYPVADWEEAEARAHCKKAGGRFEPATEEDKAMDGILELQDFDRVIVSDQVLSGDWVAAACKAESEREKLRAAREARAKKYGIGAKEGGALTSPAGYPTSDADYGDPVNYRYPCDAGHARAALTYFNQDGQREDGGYSAEEWAIVGGRLAKAISKHLEADYEYEAGKIRRKEEKSFNLDQRVQQARNAWYDRFQTKVPGGGPQNLWVKEVFDDQVVVEMPEGLFAYSYQIADDGVITFGEPVKVQVVYQPVKQQAAKGLGEEDTLIAFGDAIKAVTGAPKGKAKVGGYLVRFGSPAERDLTGTDYFAPDTYYGPHDGDGADTMVHHGVPLKAGLEGLATRILAPIKTKRDEVGIWAETVLDLADLYEQAIFKLVEAGKLKWSSGTVARLARRAADGKLIRWPIVEGSLTPVPAEPRLPAVMPLKAFLALDAGAAEPGAGTGVPDLEVVKARARAEELLVEIENADYRTETD